MAKGIELTIKGQEKLQRLAHNFMNNSATSQIGNALKLVSFQAERGMKIALTTGPTRAIDTGFLRASVRVNAFNSKRALVGPNADYGFYIHEGTRRMRARPFIKQALINEARSIEGIMNETGVKINLSLVKGV